MTEASVRALSGLWDLTMIKWYVIPLRPGRHGLEILIRRRAVGEILMDLDDADDLSF
jgi:hypothetical protein